MIKRSWSLRNFLIQSGYPETSKIMGLNNQAVYDLATSGKRTYITQTDWLYFEVWQNKSLMKKANIPLGSKCHFNKRIPDKYVKA